MKTSYTILVVLLLLQAVEAKKWALLVAGSNGFYNYRHQADICHSYHIVRSHGIAEENIVVMMYDDIANNSQNPYPGKIFNSPKGKDVYGGVPKDYIGADVTPQNFLKILQGQDMGGVGTGKTIKSGPNDHVFVYFADHGGTGIIAFPEDVLHVADLNHTLSEMHQDNKFGQLVFYMEACESGSMFRHVLKENIGVYAMTASNYKESSWGCYCDNPRKLPCLGDLFSVSWMSDSDSEDLKKETLEHQFEETKRLTNKSHVHAFGDLSITKEKVSDFQGDKETRKTHKRETVTGLVNARDIPLYQLERQTTVGQTRQIRANARKELRQMKRDRSYVDGVVKNIVESLVPHPIRYAVVMSAHPARITKLHCHKTVTLAFHQHCFNFGQNGHAMSHVHKLANLCEIGELPTGLIVDVIMDTCGQLKNPPFSVQ